MPKGYIIGHVKIYDHHAYKAYADRNDSIMAKHGGKFLVRGGLSKVMEGEDLPRHVIIEFPSYADALAAYNDPEYGVNRKVRQANAESFICVVESLE
ncbi:MAG: DUF1330 domain-containing protein [Aestuariivita sp.]|nr:DUF1330 domain-containing protein [Aestuariivita sp.]MCY4202515.1 DUF1330 domain-containing protein [Aestuariivita sp.]MCY4287337.1 DUF1330 domain-containing protein [Aestuariivita sp.]MCY4346015.1 DUF1330 domain-containing protein [Aestuariivita sp.]